MARPGRRHVAWYSSDKNIAARAIESLARELAPWPGAEVTLRSDMQIADGAARLRAGQRADVVTGEAPVALVRFVGPGGEEGRWVVEAHVVPRRTEPVAAVVVVVETPSSLYMRVRYNAEFPAFVRRTPRAVKAAGVDETELIEALSLEGHTAGGAVRLVTCTSTLVVADSEGEQTFMRVVCEMGPGRYMVTWTEGRVRSTGVTIVEVVPIGSSQPAPVEKRQVRDARVVVGKELFVKIGNGENGVTRVAFSPKGNLPTTVKVGVLELAVDDTCAQIRGTIDTAADYEYEIVMTGRDPSKGVTYAYGKIIVAQPTIMNAKPLYAAVNMAFSVGLNFENVGVVTAALLLDKGGLPESVKVSLKEGGVFIEGSVSSIGEYKYVVELTGEDPAVDVFHVKGTITAEDINITLSRVSQSTQDVTPGNDIADVEFTTTGATLVGVNTQWKSSSDEPYVAVEHDERMHSIWEDKKVTVKGKPAKVGFYLCTVWARAAKGAVATAECTFRVGKLPKFPQESERNCHVGELVEVIFKVLNATRVSVKPVHNMSAFVQKDGDDVVVTIKGTAADSGALEYEMDAESPVGNKPGKFTVNVWKRPLITFVSPLKLIIGQVTQQALLTTTDADAVVVVEGLLPGISISPGSNVSLTLTGTPTSAGDYPVTVKASYRSRGTATTQATAKVVVAWPQVTITPAGKCVSHVDIPLKITLETTGADGASVVDLPKNLPNGVSYTWNGTRANGVLSIEGVPKEVGEFKYTATASNGGGSTTADGLIDVWPETTVTIVDAERTAYVAVPMEENAGTWRAPIRVETKGARKVIFRGLPDGLMVGRTAHAGACTQSCKPVVDSTIEWTWDGPLGWSLKDKVVEMYIHGTPTTMSTYDYKVEAEPFSASATGVVATGRVSVLDTPTPEVGLADGFTRRIDGRDERQFTRDGTYFEIKIPVKFASSCILEGCFPYAFSQIQWSAKDEAITITGIACALMTHVGGDGKSTNDVKVTATGFGGVQKAERQVRLIFNPKYNAGSLLHWSSVAYGGHPLSIQWFQVYGEKENPNYVTGVILISYNKTFSGAVRDRHAKKMYTSHSDLKGIYYNRQLPGSQKHLTSLTERQITGVITGVYSRKSPLEEDMFGDLAFRQKIWHKAWNGYNEYYVSGEHVEARHPVSLPIDFVTLEDQCINVDEKEILSGLTYDTVNRRFTGIQYLSVRITG